MKTKLFKILVKHGRGHTIRYMFGHDVENAMNNYRAVFTRSVVCGAVEFTRF